MTIRCLLYARVSTLAQDSPEKTSLDTQMEACRQLAEREGWTIVGEVRDRSSGGNLRRPGMDEVRARAKSREFDLLVANSQDRISRMQTDTAILYTEFVKHKINIWTVQEGTFDQTSTGQMIRNNIAFAAELDREKRIEATYRGRRNKVERGHVSGSAPRAPFGYSFRYQTTSKGKEAKVGYDVNEAEAAVVREVFDRINSGELPRHIAEDLNRRGVRTTYANQPGYNVSGKWVAAYIRNLVRKEHFKGGKYAFNRVRMPVKEGYTHGALVTDMTNAVWLDEDAVPAIVSPDVWEKANVIVDSRITRKPTGPKTDDVWMRGGLAVCGNCGANLQLTRRKNGTPYLKCGRASKERNACSRPSPYAHTSVLEHEAWKVVRAILLDPTMLASRFRSTEQKELDVERIAELKRQTADVEKRRQRLVASLEFLDGEDFRAALRRRDELLVQEGELKAELAGIEVPADQRESELERVIRLAEWVGQQPETIDTMTVEERRSVAIELGLKVRVYPANAPERLKIDIGAWTSGEDFFEGMDWSAVSSKPTASDLKFGTALLQEAGRDGETAEDIRAIVDGGASRRNEHYATM